MIAEGEGSRHLREQLSRVYLAQISTIHGFCSSLLRDYAHELDLPVDFRIVEESEAYAIRERVMNSLLDEAYREKHEDIMATMDILGAGRDDKTLPKMIYRSYDAIMNTPNRNDTLKNLRDMLDYHYAESITESPWGKFLMEEFKVFLYGYVIGGNPGYGLDCIGKFSRVHKASDIAHDNIKEGFK
jgi:ATP-dependent helicase/nuclease subunit A